MSLQTSFIIGALVITSIAVIHTLWDIYKEYFREEK